MANLDNSKITYSRWRKSRSVFVSQRSRLINKRTRKAKRRSWRYTRTLAQRWKVPHDAIIMSWGWYKTLTMREVKRLSPKPFQLAHGSHIEIQ